MKISHQIINISEQVRKACEKFAMSKEAIEYDFYNDEELGSMCAVASTALRDVLKRRRFNPVLMQGEFGDGMEHCWVQVKDKIIDVTATQFNTKDHKYPAVYITNVNNKKYSEGKKIKKPITYFQKIVQWPESQCPNREILKKIVSQIKKKKHLETLLG